MEKSVKKGFDRADIVRDAWLVTGSVPNSFESDTGFGPLIGTHRELLRHYELLQFCVGRWPCIS